MTRIERWWWAAALCAAAPATHAHHSVSAWFDTTNMIEVEGQVTEFRWQNPHVVFTLNVADAGGATTLWAIETLSISGISRWGITQDLFKVGDRLRVAGNPARKDGHNIFVRNILLPGGREIVLGGAARWSNDTLRGSELLQARDGDASRPELGIYRTWSSGAVGAVLLPEAVQANFDFGKYPLTAAARAALQKFDFSADDPTADCKRHSADERRRHGRTFHAERLGARLDYLLTVTDAATFTMPVELKKAWIWRPEVTIGKFECQRAARQGRE